MMLSTNVLCLKKRKKRTYSISNHTETHLHTQKNKRSAGGAAVMLQITEDTPPDMLAGAMDLTIHLPGGRPVKMSVERSTPMMDLLVQVTTNNHLQLSNYTLQALAMAPSLGGSDKVLPYKPSTPIGALDIQHIRVVPKAKSAAAPKGIPPGHQPFESTFRLKVHLPRNQLFVTRVSQSVHLEEIMRTVCEEKNLNPSKFEFRHPGNLDEVLDPKLTLSDYQITEIYVVSKGARSLSQAFSSSDIMALRKEEERKQMHTKTGGGVFNLIFRRGKSSSGSGSLSSENRSISPTHSDDSRSATPPAVQQQLIVPPPPAGATKQPKAPQRKRRPAPKPPQERPPPPGVPAKKSENGLTICHSRNSSDSSGYHEASILSDNCNTSLPRRPKCAATQEDDQKLSGAHSQSTSNLSKMSSQSKSTSSLAFPSRKKKIAPPPPPSTTVLKPASCSVTSLEKPSPVVASQPTADVEQESGNPQSASLTTTIPISNSAICNIKAKCPSDEKTKFEAVPPQPISVDIGKLNENSLSLVKDLESDYLETDWQYQLPSPPKAFRDSSPVIFNSTNEAVADVIDSVVTSPELFEKLKAVQDKQIEKGTTSEVNSIVSDEDKIILNTLSLENLEKRKSLVYNRELATSLKMSEEITKQDAFANSVAKFERTYEDLEKSHIKETTKIATSTLPNFKITTYENPKQKLNIFEDDTIRSNTELSKRHSFAEIKRNSGLSDLGVMNTMAQSEVMKGKSKSWKKNGEEEVFKKSPQQREYKFFRPKSSFAVSKYFVARSESFSTNDGDWTPSKPVTRSKSQVALNKYKEDKTIESRNDENLAKSNSLFDVSGLHSLEVMRLIQNKLNTPTSSVENLCKTEEVKEFDSKSEKKEKEIRKEYSYRSTPSINLGTWSERPKIPVNVKEDPDYKLSNRDNNNYSKLIVNTINSRIEIKNKRNTVSTCAPCSTNGVNLRINQPEQKSVSINVNGCEPIATQTSGNVIIKIGGQSGTRAPFRRPLGNVNKIENGRPHSIAFGSDFDINRVPIVRSVEFKKQYKEYQNNTSITQINQTNGHNDRIELNSNTNNRYNSNNELENETNPAAKPVFRVNSYLNSAPVVRGFAPSHPTWNQPHSFSTLPTKVNINREYAVNKSVPFSQSSLRRTESSKTVAMMNEGSADAPPPPPPILPKNNGTFKPSAAAAAACFDQKEQLMQAIRDFGGKKGLRAVKA